jgi:hypothetical protein
MKKCKFDSDVIIKPDGINELDPCVYKTIEFYTNVNIEVAKCKNCGNIDIRWYRTANTEKIDLEDVDNYV